MATAMESSPALEIHGLSKSYALGHIWQHRRPVLTDLNLTVQPGEIFGYLGPNGSGKTTTLKLIAGLLRPDRGSIRVLDVDARDQAWKARAGFLPEQPYFYDYLTAPEYLDYVGRLFGMTARARRERAQALLQRVGLNRKRSSSMPMRRFSKGMLQRLGIAQALMNDPQIVFLDEPMSGLDPIGRHMMRNIILDLKAAGKTVFFCTHILPDAEMLCDRVALLRAGRLVNVGPLEEILKLDVSHFEVLATGLQGLADLPAGVVAQAMGERWRLDTPEAALNDVLRWIERSQGRILSVNPIRQSLEDFFLQEIGQAEEGGRWATED